MSSRLILPVLSCCLLLTPGCRPDLADNQRLTRPAKKASPTPPKTATSSEKPDVGSGRPSAPVARVACPDLPKAVYEAAAQPTALPERDAPLDRWGTQKWVEALENQVSWTRLQLGVAINEHAACQEKVRQGPLPVASSPPPRAP